MPCWCVTPPQSGCSLTLWPTFTACWEYWPLLTTSFGLVAALGAHTLLLAVCTHSGIVLASGSWLTPNARCWLPIFRTRGMGYGLVGALTWVMGLLELAAPSLYEPLRS